MKISKIYRIEQQELNDLIEKAERYECLMNGGVDNWEWYGECFEDLDWHIIQKKKKYDEGFELDQKAAGTAQATLENLAKDEVLEYVQAAIQAGQDPIELVGKMRDQLMEDLIAED